MTLSEDMLNTAMHKAVEAGLLPRHACREDRAGHRELMRFILLAALDVERSQTACRCRVPVQERLAGVRRHDGRA